MLKHYTPLGWAAKATHPFLVRIGWAVYALEPIPGKPYYRGTRCVFGRVLRKARYNLYPIISEPDADGATGIVGFEVERV